MGDRLYENKTVLLSVGLSFFVRLAVCLLEIYALMRVRKKYAPWTNHSGIGTVVLTNT